MRPGTLWDYETAYRVARAFEQADGTWLEECFDRSDVETPARLAAAVDIPITGGEGDRGLGKFARYLAARSFDIVQPDAYNCGGILTLRKISALAEGFGIPCIPHGTHGLALAGWLQVVGALPNCRLLELAITVPPLLPWEQWAPLAQLLKGGSPFPNRGHGNPDSPRSGPRPGRRRNRHRSATASPDAPAVQKRAAIAFGREKGRQRRRLSGCNRASGGSLVVTRYLYPLPGHYRLVGRLTWSGALLIPMT